MDLGSSLAHDTQQITIAQANLDGRSRKSALLLLAPIDLGLKIKRDMRTVTVGVYPGNHGDGKGELTSFRKDNQAAATRRHHYANVSLSKDEEELICLKNQRKLQLQKVVNYSKLQTS